MSKQIVFFVVLNVAGWAACFFWQYTGPGVLYVCCTPGEGCEGGGKPSECEGDLYWCDAGETNVGPDGLPVVICHD